MTRPPEKGDPIRALAQRVLERGESLELTDDVRALWLELTRWVLAGTPPPYRRVIATHHFRITPEFIGVYPVPGLLPSPRFAQSFASFLLGLG